MDRPNLVLQSAKTRHIYPPKMQDKAIWPLFEFQAVTGAHSQRVQYPRREGDLSL